MNKIMKTLIGLHIFVGIGAMAGGLGAITSPNNPMGMTTDALKNAPFTNFLIPGLILFFFLGVGNIIGAILLKKWKYGVYGSNVMGWGMILWIIIQCIMLEAIHPLHIIFEIIGIIQASLAFALLYHKGYFPAAIIKRIVAKSR